MGDVMVSYREPAVALFLGSAPDAVRVGPDRDFRAFVSEIMEAVSPDRMPDDVLIVEDDPIIALDFEDTILGFGVKTVRTAGSVAKALEMIADRAPDFALLDVGLVREKSFADRRAAGGAENSVCLRHRLRRRCQVSRACSPDKPTAAETLFDRRAARGAETPIRRRRQRLTGAAGRFGIR